MMLCDVEEQRLLSGIKSGDAQATATLMGTYKPLLYTLASRLFGAEIQDLVQAGYVGLIEAAAGYQFNRGARFITYALPWALGEMKRACRHGVEGSLPRVRSAQIRRQEEVLCRTLGRHPRLHELAESCKISCEDLLRTLEMSKRPRSLDDEGEVSLKNTLCGTDDLSMVDALNLRMALSDLSAIEQKLIVLRYYREKTQKETAGLLGKSQAQVSRIERQALDHLHRILS